MSPSIFLNYITFDFFSVNGYDEVKGLNDIKRTCDPGKGNQIIRPMTAMTIDECKKLCDKKKKCEFFFWQRIDLLEGGCMGFKHCDKLKNMGLPGTTYQKE